METLDIEITLPIEMQQQAAVLQAPTLFRDRTLHPAVNDRIRLLNTDLFVAAKTWDLDRSPVRLTFHLALVK